MVDEKKIDTAVAIEYDGKTTPKISASGINEVAEEIVRIAEENNIHLHDDPVLARMLATLDLGTEIPRDLYLIIAEIIAFAYHLEGKVPENWTPPEPPDFEPPVGLENN